MRLAGKVAFITGAARGQGRAEAVRFAEEGADIVAIDICEDIPEVPFPGSTPEDLEETVRLVEALDRRIVARRADVRDAAALRAALDEGVAELGGLDIVMANAGVVSFGPIEELSEPEWDLMLDVNLSGVWKTVKAAIPHLRRRGGGSIIITSSVSGLITPINLGHYNASKHGVIGLMKTLTNELGPDNIRANCICPSAVASPMLLNEATYRLFRPELDAPRREDIEPIIRKQNALPAAMAESVDIANAALFLASDESRFISGLAVPVDLGSITKVAF